MLKFLWLMMTGAFVGTTVLITPLALLTGGSGWLCVATPAYLCGGMAILGTPVAWVADRRESRE